MKVNYKILFSSSSINLEADLLNRIKEIDEYLSKVPDLEVERNELKSALNIMKRLGDFVSAPKVEPEAASVQVAEDSAAIDLSKIPVKAATSGTSLQSNVEDLIKRFGTQEFSVNHIEAVLNQMGKGSDAKHFKSRISIAIKKLKDKGVVELVHEGAGNDPHRYKNKETTLPELMRPVDDPTDGADHGAGYP